MSIRIQQQEFDSSGYEQSYRNYLIRLHQLLQSVGEPDSNAKIFCEDGLVALTTSAPDESDAVEQWLIRVGPSEIDTISEVIPSDTEGERLYRKLSGDTASDCDAVIRITDAVQSYIDEREQASTSTE